MNLISPAVKDDSQIVFGPQHLSLESMQLALDGVKTTSTPEDLVKIAELAFYRAAIDENIPPNVQPPQTRAESERLYGKAEIGDLSVSRVVSGDGVEYIAVSGTVGGAHYDWAEAVAGKTW